MPWEIVDGNNVIKVNESATRAINRTLKGACPTFLKLKTCRRSGHFRNDSCVDHSCDESDYTEIFTVLLESAAFVVKGRDKLI